MLGSKLRVIEPSYLGLSPGAADASGPRAHLLVARLRGRPVHRWPPLVEADQGRSL